ncbi:hypothetical protein VNO77_23841 [Canavalia gladiata]|uniref:Uncharacterized protein n=1 Tax=Canavalia gladiata TaxID=3824 RepID=A0AAN9L545_CANGL
MPRTNSPPSSKRKDSFPKSGLTQTWEKRCSEHVVSVLRSSTARIDSNLFQVKANEQGKSFELRKSKFTLIFFLVEKKISIHIDTPKTITKITMLFPNVTII